MITAADFYHVMTAMVPLYVAMILAYGSVKWWRIFTPDQCSGINRFVALFAVPLLSFHFISTNNPYTMNLRFIAADTLQKLMVLAMLTAWSHLSSRGSLEWTITLFSLSTLPNTLVMGIPLLKGMYGEFSGSLMVQIVVLQCIIWYTLMLFMFEYRGARMLITEQFPDTAANIASIVVDPDVVSLDGRRDAIETEMEVKEDGRIHVTVRRSNASRSDIYSRRSMGFSSTTPRPSNLTNAEIYSLQSSRNPTPRGSSFNHTDFYSMVGRSSNFAAGDAFGVVRTGATPRPSNYEDDAAKPKYPLPASNGGAGAGAPHYPAPNPAVAAAAAPKGAKKAATNGQAKGGGEDLHMFVWSSSASPVSDVFGGGAPDYNDATAVKSPRKMDGAKDREDYVERDDFSFGNRGVVIDRDAEAGDEKAAAGGGGADPTKAMAAAPTAMPPTSVMTRLILIMVWRKLIRNPNTYSSLIGLIWSLVCFRWNFEMPAIVLKSISILSDAGLGMAMFSLGLFMALQPNMIACGNKVATYAMAVRFLAGPAVMAAASFAVGLRGTLLHVAIVQVNRNGKEQRLTHTHTVIHRVALTQLHTENKRSPCGHASANLLRVGSQHRAFTLSCSSLLAFPAAFCSLHGHRPFYVWPARKPYFGLANLFFFSVGFYLVQTERTNRQLCRRALSPSSSQRSTACTPAFSAQLSSLACSSHCRSPSSTTSCLGCNQIKWHACKDPAPDTSQC